jgi:hypothetical protein
LEPIDELRGQVLGIGGAAAIPKQENFVAPPQDVSKQLRRGHHLFRLLRDDPAFEQIGLRHGLGQARRQGHRASENFSGSWLKKCSTLRNYTKNTVF